MVIAEKKYKVAELFASYSNAESEMAQFVLEKVEVTLNKVVRELGNADAANLESAKIGYDAVEVKYIEAEKKVDEFISKAKLARSQLREASTISSRVKKHIKLWKNYFGFQA
jgi:phosphate uptake regulator